MKITVSGLAISRRRFCCVIPVLCVKYLQAVLNKDALLEITFVDEKTIHKLNKKFRNYDKPTDVLSFIGDAKEYLGSIVMCNKIIAKYNPDKKFAHALHATLIHGVLHLLGYDHECQSDAEVMEDLEIKVYNYIRDYLGLDD